MTNRLNADGLVGQTVHLLMWHAGIPQRELATQLALNQSALSKKLRGRRSWTLDELLTTARVLHVPVSELMPGDDYQPIPAGRGRAVEHL